MSRSRDEILEKMEDLRAQATAGLITDKEYWEKVTKLQRQIEAITLVPQDKTQEFVDQEAEVNKKKYIEGQPPSTSFLNRVNQLRNQNEPNPGESRREFEKRIIKKAEQEQKKIIDTYANRANYFESVSSKLISQYLDPAAGIVYDKKKKGARYVSGSLEALKNALKLQVRFTPTQLKRIDVYEEKLEDIERKQEEEEAELLELDEFGSGYETETFEKQAQESQTKLEDLEKEKKKVSAKEPIYKVRAEAALVLETRIG